VNLEFETFIQSHIEQRRSLAIETTLRSRVTFDQIAAAKTRDFRVTMLTPRHGGSRTKSRPDSSSLEPWLPCSAA
jgi:hypothetical protein